MPMRERRAARSGGLACLVAGAVALSACSSGPSMVLVYVQASERLPPIRILRAGLTDALTTDAAPGASPCLDLVRVAGDVGGAVRPVPYVFPLYLTINVSRDLAGSRTLAIDGYSGIEDASGTVDNGCADGGDGGGGDSLQRTIPMAAGSAPVTVEAGAKTQALAPLTLVAGTCGDHILDSPEKCDDGNHVIGDGCDPECRIEGLDASAPGDDGAASGDGASD